MHFGKPLASLISNLVILLVVFILLRLMAVEFHWFFDKYRHPFYSIPFEERSIILKNYFFIFKKRRYLQPLFLIWLLPSKKAKYLDKVRSGCSNWLRQYVLPLSSLYCSWLIWYEATYSDHRYYFTFPFCQILTAFFVYRILFCNRKNNEKRSQKLVCNF